MGRRWLKKDNETTKLGGREGEESLRFPPSLSCPVAFGEVFSVPYLCCHGNSLDSREELNKTRSRWIARKEKERKREREERKQRRGARVTRSRPFVPDFHATRDIRKN